jgi:hypothetical protein
VQIDIPFQLTADGDGIRALTGKPSAQQVSVDTIETSLKNERPADHCLKLEEFAKFLCEKGKLPPEVCAIVAPSKPGPLNSPLGPIPFGPPNSGALAPTPSGKTLFDPIPLVWFKPLFLYPDPIPLTPSTGGVHDFDMQIPGQFVEPGSDIGVHEEFIPEVDKVMRLERVLDKVDRRNGAERFRSLLRRHGRDMRIENEEPDHVQDVAWGGVDKPENLWPLNAKLNQDAGRAFQIFRITYAVNPGELPRPSTTNVPLGTASKRPGVENVVGRFFIIKGFGLP